MSARRATWRFLGWASGSTRPVFALLRAFPCPISTGRAQSSDWLNLAWLLAATRGALD